MISFRDAEKKASSLDDPQAMVRHFKRLARQLLGRDAAEKMATGVDGWFADPTVQ